MYLSELFEWGEIVKNVNTTVDVDTDEIQKQGRKFQNKFDKENRPPSMRDSVKLASKKDKMN